MEGVNFLFFYDYSLKTTKYTLMCIYDLMLVLVANHSS